LISAEFVASGHSSKKLKTAAIRGEDYVDCRMCSACCAAGTRDFHLLEWDRLMRPDVGHGQLPLAFQDLLQHQVVINPSTVSSPISELSWHDCLELWHSGPAMKLPWITIGKGMSMEDV
jgi:hypothetical protein